MICLSLALTVMLPVRSRADEEPEPDPIAEFVERAYLLILDREAEPDGFVFWYDNITQGSMTAAQLVNGFMTSEEFNNRDLSDEEKLDILYHVMFDREPDEGGFAFWKNFMECGVSISAIVNGFTTSDEFAAVCERFKMIPGSVSLGENRDLNLKVTEFVARSYRIFLERKPDIMGLNDWTGRIARGEIAATELINGIVTSEEFLNRGLSDAQVLNLIYHAMFDRDIDAAGQETWTGILGMGVSISCVVGLIGTSDEFTALCRNYGMLPGEVKLTQPRDFNYQLTGFLSQAYLKLSGRAATVSELNSGADAILSGSKKVTDVLSSIIALPESQAKLVSNEDYLSVVFDVCLGGQPTKLNVSGALAGLSNGITRSHILSLIAKEPAYISRLAAMGISNKMEAPKKMIALTFDDGPYSPVTNRILDVMETYGAHATFFVVGNRVNSYRSCIIRAVNLGCEIGNHTWDHTSLTSLSGASIASQISQCNNAVYNLTGERPKVMRPVGGAFNSTVSNNVGMPMIIWSVDTNDWKYRDATHVANAILNNVRDGDIVLMHDLYASTASAIETVVPQLIAQGYTLVTVSELAEYREKQLQSGQAYYSIRG